MTPAPLTLASDDAPTRASLAASRGYAASVECRRCGGRCYLQTVPTEICDETHRCDMRLCRGCWEIVKAEYARDIEATPNDETHRRREEK